MRYASHANVGNKQTRLFSKHMTEKLLPISTNLVLYCHLYIKSQESNLEKSETMGESLGDSRGLLYVEVREREPRSMHVL